MTSTKVAVLAIAAIAILFFAPLVLHPAQTLYSDTSDLLTFHLPYRQFHVQSWQETGELPLWCPYIFGGMPFAHDIGASMFYPPHWLLLLFPTDWLGAATSWLVVVHVMIAGWCMYAYARFRGLSGIGALVAAMGFMLAGKWMLHLLAGGHYNMIALAWLPLVLLFLEQAIERRSLLHATWAGVSFSLLILCAYPYVTLYAGLFVAVWTLGAALGFGNKNALAAWAGTGMWTAFVAVALGAVQLIPAIDSAAEASRADGIGLSLDYFANGFRMLVGLVGPPLTDEPNSWENRAGLGLVWLTLIVIAAIFSRGRQRFEAAVLVGMLVFSLGGAALVQWLPGFRLFRLPSRMLLIAALPAALFAGRAVQLLIAEPGMSLEMRTSCRRIFVKLTVCVLLLAGALTLSVTIKNDGVQPRFHSYWITLLLLLPAVYFLLGIAVPAKYRWLGLAWLAVLTIDVGSMSTPLVAVRPEAEIYVPSDCVRYLAERRSEHGRVLDYPPVDFSTNHTPLWPGLPAMQQVEPLRGFNPIDVRRYKEFLQFIAGERGPLQTLDGMFTGPLVGSFPVKNQSLADLLGVRFLLQPADLPLAAVIPDEENRKHWSKVAEDSSPTTFDIISVQPGGRDCGFHKLPPYAIYENTQVLPRAFVVPQALPLPENDALPLLKATDFRQMVLLEGHAAAEPSATAQSDMRPVMVREYQPNRVEIDAGGGPGGFLLLTDVWFPGWICTIDGERTPVYRANYLFRAIELPDGARNVVFTFAPASVMWGKRISFTAAVLVILATISVPLTRRCNRGELSKRACTRSVTNS